MKSFAVLLLFAAQIAVVTCRVSKKLGCSVAFSDIRMNLKNGETYTHRCDVYTCVKGKLQENTPRCKIRLGYKQENLCRQWSEDGCCCDLIGCTDIHGGTHEPGAWYMTHKSRDPTRPECGRYCKCKAGRKLCRLRKECQNKPQSIVRAVAPLKIRHMKVLFVHEK